MQLKDLNRDSSKIKTKTLCFLIKENKVLLAMKKRGFGVGKWNGVGGKVKEGESVENAAIREAKEEIGVILRKFNNVAILNFHFEKKADWDSKVMVYLAEDWLGKPKESEEMKPKWFDFDKIPYEKMWWDDQIWLPRVLGGELIQATFLFDSSEKVTDQIITNVKKFE